MHSLLEDCTDNGDIHKADQGQEPEAAEETDTETGVETAESAHTVGKARSMDLSNGSSGSGYCCCCGV